MAEPNIELLDGGACRELLQFSHVGRIAMSIGALPAIVPVTYLLDGDTLVFRLVTGTPLAPSVVVAFEAGHIDPTGQGGWSVHLIGSVQEVSDPTTRLHLAVTRAHPWNLAERDKLFRLPLEMMSGARIVPTPSSQAA